MYSLKWLYVFFKNLKTQVFNLRNQNKINWKKMGGGNKDKATLN